MTPQQKVVNVALDEVGYLEKASNSNLYSKTANAGRSNFTKYAADLDKTDIFNGPKNGYEWCTTFVCWCFVQAFGLELAREMLYLPVKSLAASCTQAIQYYRKAGKYGYTPATGAQIFFNDASGAPCHTGLVVGYDSAYVYTVEGNTSGGSTVVSNGGGVAKKSYPRNYSRINGYGYPDFSLASGSVETGTEKKKELITYNPWREYKNGSTEEPVFRDTDMTTQTGSLNPWESCYCTGRYGDAYCVIYKLDGRTDDWAIGYVAYSGGVE